MTVRGHVRNGVIVLDAQAILPEGAAVVVSVVDADVEPAPRKDRPALRHSGTLKLGRDASRRIDQELYGEPDE